MANWRSITSIPIFLEANDETSLMKLMLENNLLNGKRFNYHPPIQKRNGKWVVWFVDDITEYKKNEVGEQLDIMPKLDGS
jgi:hypothetical protein